MLISGGKILAIDKVNHDNTLSGDGVFEPLGVNKDLLNRAVYFSDTNPSPYFTWNDYTNTLSANSAVKFFNVSYTYNVNPSRNPCVDFVYSGTMAVNGVSANHFIEGYKANETHNLSYNFLNDAPNFKYTFVPYGDCLTKKVKVSCVGFIYDESEPEPTDIINVLANENSEIIDFNGIVLRV
ncbi:MAG: hypothetical protein IKP65_07210 [Alphaproteobacteria bacterium]|nr:hypothetical protein [Alphaproteobacteria bacterium]